MATFVLAMIVFGLGGWAWAVPILTFFILSSLLSKAGKRRKQTFSDTFEKSGVRDVGQVLANGGLAGLFALLGYFFNNDLFYQLYLVSLAVVNADTWATEIGVLFGKPVLITTFKPAQPGVSGAVSFFGTLASLTGSFIIALSGLYFFNNLTNKTALLITITLSGLVGSIADSFMGALVQGQYTCSVCGKYTERKIHCAQPTNLISGQAWLNNDWVNILATVVGLIFYLLITI